MSMQNPIIASDGRERERTVDDEDMIEDTETRMRRNAADGGQIQGQSQHQNRYAADGGQSVDAEVESSAPYMTQETSADAGDRWKRVQAEFVDDPRQSVSEAHQLVSDLMQQIVDAFSKERDSLERQWSQGENVSTEELRVCLQRYRAFFTRLLPSVRGLDKAS